MEAAHLSEAQAVDLLVVLAELLEVELGHLFLEVKVLLQKEVDRAVDLEGYSEAQELVREEVPEEGFWAAQVEDFSEEEGSVVEVAQLEVLPVYYPDYWYLQIWILAEVEALSVLEAVVPLVEVVVLLAEEVAPFLGIGVF